MDGSLSLSADTRRQAQFDLVAEPLARSSCHWLGVRSCCGCFIRWIVGPMLLTVLHAGLVVYWLSVTENTGPDARTFVMEAAGVTTQPRVMTTTPSFDNEPSPATEYGYGAFDELGNPSYDKDRRLERSSEPVLHSVQLSQTEHEFQSADTSRATSPKTLSLGLGPVPRRVVDNMMTMIPVVSPNPSPAPVSEPFEPCRYTNCSSPQPQEAKLPSAFTILTRPPGRLHNSTRAIQKLLLRIRARAAASLGNRTSTHPRVVRASRRLSGELTLPKKKFASRTFVEPGRGRYSQLWISLFGSVFLLHVQSSLAEGPARTH